MNYKYGVLSIKYGKESNEINSIHRDVQKGGISTTW